MRASPALVALLSLGLALPRPGQAVDEAVRGLQGLRRVALVISFSPAHPGVPAEDLERRLEEMLSATQPAPLLDPRSPDRLRLTVSVSGISTSDLRGFYLPLSGKYGIGQVRLSVERLASINGVGAPVRAVVWEAERQARGPWRSSATEIMAIADDLAEAFLDDYRRALSP